MDINAIRIQRLNYLWEKYEREQIDKGNDPLRKDFAKLLEMSEQMFCAIKNNKKSLGTIVARRIEQCLGLPVGYMDTPINQVALSNKTELHYVDEFLALLRSTDYAYVRVFIESMKQAKTADRSKVKVLMGLFNKNLGA